MLSLKDEDVATILREQINRGYDAPPDTVLYAYRRELLESVALDQFRRFVSGQDPVPTTTHDSDVRACALRWMAPGVQTDLIPALVALLSTEKKRVRSQSARHLTAYGDAALLAHLPAAAEIDREMAVGIIDGFKVARLAGCADTPYRRALYPLVETFLSQPWTWMTWDEPLEVALLHSDAEKGRDVLLPRFDDFDGRGMCPAITAFVEMPHLVESATLLRLVEENAREDLPVHILGQRYGSALQVLAAQRHSAAAQLISETLAGPFVIPAGAHHTVHTAVILRQAGAAQALGILHSFPLDDEWFFLRQKFIPRSHMSTVESDLDTGLDAAVNCDGVEQYLEYRLRETLLADLAALERMEDTGRAALLRQLFDLFGPEGPPADIGKRCAKLEELGDEALDAMRAFDVGWSKCPESIFAKRQVYALKHRAEIEALPDARYHSL